MKIAVKGYYGFGNLGDDILMITTVDLVRLIFPDHKLFIITESKKPAYIKRWYPDAEIINSNTDIKVDYIIDGGGGIYFDFQESGTLYYLLNRLIHLIGFRNYSKAYKLYRRIKRNPGVQAGKKFGIGIGIGDFAKSSSKFFSSIYSLSNYDFLIVRDTSSYKILEKYKFKYPYLHSTDLAFNTDSWLPKDIEYQPKKDIGIILRDWEYDGNQYLDKLIKDADQLVKKGYSVAFFSFDKNGDTAFIQKVVGRYEINVWDPNTTDLEDYLKKLSKCKAIITSRAHGAILSACLGIPGICLNIEPKLSTIVQMLKYSYQLHSVESNEIVSTIKDIIYKHDYYQDMVRKDVSENKRKLTASVISLKEFNLSC